MTNRSSSKQHGLSTVKLQQPKSKLRTRANKKKAALRKIERRKVIFGHSSPLHSSKKSQKEAISA